MIHRTSKFRSPPDKRRNQVGFSTGSYDLPTTQELRIECRATEMPILSAINENAPCMNQNRNESRRDLRYWLDVWLGFVALVSLVVGIGHSLDWLKARNPIDPHNPKIVGLADFMQLLRGSVQIDRGGSGSGVFGALRAPATNLRFTRRKQVPGPLPKILGFQYSSFRL